MHNPEPSGRGASARAQDAARSEPRKPFSFYAELWVAAFDPRPMPVDPKRVFKAYAKVRFGSQQLRHTYRVSWPSRRP